MIFDLLAILCFLFLPCVMLAFAIVVIRKNRLGVAVLSAFLAGGLLAGILVWRATRPQGLPFRESLRAGITDQGLRDYGHPIEHQAEVAICLVAYATVLGGGLCAGGTLAGMKIRAWRRTA